MVMIKVFITGVGGLLGSTYARYLINKGGYEVHGCDTFIGGIPENVPELVKFHELIFLNLIN